MKFKGYTLKLAINVKMGKMGAKRFPKEVFL